MNDKTINTSFRVTEKRLQQLKIAGARRRMSIQEMLEQGLELLLSKKIARSADKKTGGFLNILGYNKNPGKGNPSRAIASPTRTKPNHAREAVNLLKGAKIAKSGRARTAARAGKGRAS